MEYEVTTPTGHRRIIIDLPVGPFGVLISGGVDSTVLLHLVCRASAASGRAFFTCNVARGMGTEDAALRASERLRGLYGVDITHRQLCTVGDHAEQVRNAAESYLGTGEVTTLFVADTSNPPNFAPGPWRQPVENQHAFPGWVFPFLHCDKSHTVALAHDLGLDDVLRETHTCTEQAVGECGRCWQCRERAWGFAQNKLTDPLASGRRRRSSPAK